MARLGGAEREKYPTQESLAKAYEGVRRVDYDKLEVIADSKDEVQIAFAIIMSGKKDGAPLLSVAVAPWFCDLINIRNSKS